ncbi:MAG: discoidin domain-containing protein, partial [Verrucomicrobia bacterium]|nr:discoidin domain-containing protein [Verrucomicrobiota bacterium]
GMPEASSSSKDSIGHEPFRAVDGIRTLESSWWAKPYPAMWQMDLGEPKRLRGVHVWPYWGSRYYQYTVEVSTDGKDWQQVVDMSKNTTLSTPEGDRFEFESTDVRYVRVNMLYHTRNTGVHLVEVEVIEE